MKRNPGTAADYRERADTFRQQLQAQAGRTRDEQVWPEVEEWVAVDAVATCHTRGCPAEDIPREVRLGENGDGVYRASCGPCRQPHTDVVATFDDGPVVLVEPASPAAPSRPPADDGPVRDGEPT